MKRNVYATQGACLTVALLRKPHTYMEMIDLKLSVSPWKRVAEYLRVTPGLQLVKTTKKVNGEKLTAWRVVRA